MSKNESYQVLEPLAGKPVEISHRLVDRLRGRYPIGKMMPDGKPEFGWKDYGSSPVQEIAANEIDRLERENAELRVKIELLLAGSLI